MTDGKESWNKDHGCEGIKNDSYHNQARSSLAIKPFIYNFSSNATFFTDFSPKIKACFKD